jgi:hypothetical protein
MASTRNNNTFGNYCLQQRSNQDSAKYLVYTNSANGYAYDTRLPGNGLLAGQMPWNKLSENAADIESFLFGINSTNLVTPEPPLVPQLTSLRDANVFEKETVFIPEPLVIQKNQRPFPVPK